MPKRSRVMLTPIILQVSSEFGSPLDFGNYGVLERADGADSIPILYLRTKGTEV